MPIPHPCESREFLRRLFTRCAWGFSKSSNLRKKAEERSRKAAQEKLDLFKDKNHSCMPDCRLKILKRVRVYPASCTRVWWTLWLMVRCCSGAVAEVAIVCYKPDKTEPTWDTYGTSIEFTDDESGSLA